MPISKNRRNFVGRFTELHLSTFLFLTKIMAYVISDNCVACGTCMSVCPTGAISEGDIYKIDPDTCIDCGTCADSCPNEAIAPGA